jgi:23S rRNA (pseudouridine1915-N3)-methyltransferase
MTIQIITVGNKPRPAVNDLITTYVRRLPRSIQLSWVYINHGSSDAVSSMKQEAEKILKAIPKNYMVVLLDETGLQLSSKEFSSKFISPNQNICIVIGGAYGVAQEVKSKSDFVLSLSKLVFPHQLVRILLAEQIYRAHTIATNHPYHHS